MFILLGFGGRRRVLGEGFLLECPSCNNAVVWEVVATSSGVSVFFVPVAGWNRKYWMVCPICSAAIPLESKEEALRTLAGAFQSNETVRTELINRLTEDGEPGSTAL